MPVRLRGLSRVFAGNGAPVTAIANLTFDVADGEFLCVVGPSGCGKTTLLRTIAGLLAPSSGSAEVDAAPAPERPTTAMVFQDHGLFPWMTVVDNVAFGLERRSLPRAEKRRIAGDFLARIGLRDFRERFPHELSAGMQQRAGIARAFVADAPVLLMDEPFGALDAQTRLLLQEELLALWSASAKTVLFVTHDIDEAVRLADRILVLSGRPARVRAAMPVPLPRPRGEEALASAAALAIRQEVWELLRDEARRELEAAR
ncbi:MAG TPA: ABC transporter ATP-binding protein [Thermoanaerobaculia bacterium]|nr:ABC transporter ATP-binding protein [Thermoanaerobaculia bacterium]